MSTSPQKVSRSPITLSYILPTYNRLSYLKKSLAALKAHKKADEEIIVVDGGSKDGTSEHLRELFERGEVDQFVSEPDQGPGHAINKGMLMARGILLKHMNDDDEYYLDEIEKCKAFMLSHGEIDVLGSNGIDHNGNEYHREEDFLIRKRGPYHPFMMADQGMMIRRSALALTGLTDTSFVFFDGEFTVRVTAGKARMAWFTGLTWRHVLNQGSLSLKKAVWKAEAARLRGMYPNLYSKWKHYVPKPLRLLLRSFFPKKRLATFEEASVPTFLY